MRAFILVMVWPLQNKNTLTIPQPSDKLDLVKACPKILHTLGTIVPVGIPP
jgi:hypothetical protein